MEIFAVLVLLATASAQFANDLSNIESFIDNSNLIIKTKYQPLYHISAPMGWLNHPAGFTYFNGQYHVFYQYHPYNGAWGHVVWGHAVSGNLIDWVHYPPALTPKEHYERHGCLAGSVLVHNNYLMLFYTGNVVIKSKTRQSQNLAISSDGVIFQKYLYNPIIKKSPYARFDFGEFRNPKVWRFRNSFYMIVGVKSKARLGKLLLYTSHDMFNWKLNGSIAESYGDMGYMWESPDLFEIDGQHILILSVRGIHSDDGYRFRNLYQTGYVVGRFCHHMGRFEDTEVSTATFNELDSGHDFYAAHTMQAEDGRRLLIAWLGMWESSLEESTDGWTSLLTIARELHLSSEGRLLMVPVKEALELRTEVLEDAWYSPGEVFDAGTKTFELIVNSRIGANYAVIILEWNGNYHYAISYSATLGHVMVNRGDVDGVRRADWAPHADQVSWRILVDHSSVEVFCGAGEVVFSSRIYPRKAIKVRVGGDTPLHIVQYKLRRSIGFDQRIRQILKDNLNERSKA